MPLHNLTRFPRLEFIGAPTPLEYLPRFSDYLGREIFIKRDDVTPMAMGGNKLRKLEFLAADALREGADTLITAGAIQSNHVRQTAAVAAKLGLHCVALLENPIGTTAENPLPAKVMQAGAAGYLSKGAAPQEVVSAIRSVYSGQRYIASDIAQQMALSQIEPEKTESPFASLSERELQIMLMITKGQKVNEISEQLNLSPKTVNSYRYRMFSKLNIHGDVELTHLAIRHGLCNAETLSSQ